MLPCCPVTPRVDWLHQRPCATPGLHLPRRCSPPLAMLAPPSPSPACLRSPAPSAVSESTRSDGSRASSPAAPAGDAFAPAPLSDAPTRPAPAPLASLALPSLVTSVPVLASLPAQRRRLRAEGRVDPETGVRRLDRSGNDEPAAPPSVSLPSAHGRLLPRPALRGSRGQTPKSCTGKAVRFVAEGLRALAVEDSPDEQEREREAAVAVAVRRPRRNKTISSAPPPPPPPSPPAMHAVLR